MTIQNGEANAEPKTPNGEEPEITEPSSTATLTVEELKAHLEKVEATNRRLLEESKKHKSKAQTLEREKLEAEGKKDELIQQLKEENVSLKERTKIAAIASSLAEEAQRRGCEDWDQVWMLSDQDEVQFDEETEDVIGVKEFFDQAQKNPRLQKFFNKREKITPDVNTPSIQTEFDYKKNPLEYLMKIKKEKGMDAYKSAVDRLTKEGLIR